MVGTEREFVLVLHYNYEVDSCMDYKDSCCLGDLRYLSYRDQKNMGYYREEGGIHCCCDEGIFVGDSNGLASFDLASGICLAAEYSCTGFLDSGNHDS